MIMCIILQTYSERGHIHLASAVHKPWQGMTCVTITKVLKGEFREWTLPTDRGVYCCFREYRNVAYFTSLQSKAPEMTHKMYPTMYTQPYPLMNNCCQAKQKMWVNDMTPASFPQNKYSVFNTSNQIKTVPKISISNKCFILLIFYLFITVSTKILRSTTVFKIYTNKKCFKLQISILKGGLTAFFFFFA